MLHPSPVMTESKIARLRLLATDPNPKIRERVALDNHTPADVFEAVGGMCTHLPGNYNDVDYCLKLRFAGWSVVYEPGAVLYHFESRSRAEGGGVGTDEVEFIRGRWATRLAGDEFTPLVP